MLLCFTAGAEQVTEESAMNDSNVKRSSSTVPQQPLLLKADEVAHLLSISSRTLWRLVRAGEFPSPIYVGGSTRWRLTDIENWVDDGRPGGGRRDVPHVPQRKVTYTPDSADSLKARQ